MDLFNRRREIEIESCINPQSAIRNYEALTTASMAFPFKPPNRRSRF
jgi:hypothetical protein